MPIIAINRYSHLSSSYIQGKANKIFKAYDVDIIIKYTLWFILSLIVNSLAL